ncbi:hypothetical protein Pfo_010055 [Paulownia fortunei]|nr:hypothetical protein Pfo_010055 [Paulownia fortunei]
MVTEANDVVSPKLSTTLPPPATTTTVTGVGLIISITDAIRSFLAAASTDSHLSEDLRNLSSSLIMHSTVPYKSLKTIWFGSERDTRPDLSFLLSGSNFIFTSPKPREKSEELKVRLKKLEEAAERKAYDELVKDITPRKGVEEPFSSYKDQLGFGKHFDYMSCLQCSRDTCLDMQHSEPCSATVLLCAAGGILGLVGAMLVETLLFIVRSSDQDRRSPPSSSPSSTLKIKKNQ